MNKRILSSFFYFLSAPVLVSLFIARYFKVWSLDFKMPLLFGGGDGTVPLFIIKNIVNGSGHQVSQFVGAPFEFNFYDFPLSGETIQILALKCLSFFSDSPFWIHNTYFFLKFPIAAILAYLVLCDLKIEKLISVFFAVLFALSPLVFSRGIGHYFLGVIYSVPIGVWLCYLIYENRLPRFSLFANDNNHAFNYRLIFFLAGIAILAGGGIYYSFYACVFMFFSYVFMMIQSDKVIKLENLKPLAPIFLVIAVTVCYSIPNLIYYSKFGKNLMVGQRQAFESDLFGLKITALFMPISNHYIQRFSEIAQNYSRWPMNNENAFASIGFLGSVGLFLSVIWSLLESPFSSIKELTKQSASFLGLTHDELKRISFNSKLILYGLLYASIGGFSYFVAVWFPNIRAHNRISVYIMFFSMVFLATFVNSYFKQKIETSFLRRIVFAAFMFFVTAVASFDQAGKRPIMQTSATLTYVATTKKFIEELESKIDIGDKIMQLPVAAFPEIIPAHKMLDYTHLTAFMFSKKAHWSYPAMKGRPAYMWQASIANLQPDELIQQLQNRGFKGIYLDRFGYPDGAAALEAKLAKIIRSPPIESEDRRYSFFKLPQSAFEIVYNEFARPEKMIIYDSAKIQYSTIVSYFFFEKLKRFIENQPGKQMTIDFSKHPDLVDMGAYDEAKNDVLNTKVEESFFDGGVSCSQNSVLNVKRASDPINIKIVIQNDSKFWWHLSGKGLMPLNIRTILYNKKMEPINGDLPFIFDGQTNIPPRSKKSVNFTFPLDRFIQEIPAGESILEIGLVQEGYAWAKDINPKGIRCLISVRTL
jgi:phosphoglycerol transferase